MEHHVVTIGVAGGSASGKSTISRAILDQAGQERIAYLLHDSYYKDLVELGHDRSQINYDHPDSLETSLLVEHILQLKAGKPVEVPIYDFVEDRRLAQTRTVQPQPVILVEGILVLAEPELRKLFDIKIFVDTPPDIRFIRRLSRDVAERGRSMESVIDQYLKTVRPMHNAFVEPSKRYADIIVPQGGYNTVAVDLIAQRVRSLL
ncbi:MAG: uridine kinase [Anaerolineae bacterium]|nr:MAG: uridine kinase [Anaerolineae bacterium]